MDNYLIYNKTIILICIFSIISIQIEQNNKEFLDILPLTFIQKEKSIYNLKDIFKCRELFISDANITKEYVRFIKPLKNNKIYYKKYDNIKFYEDYFGEREYQINYNEFGKLCVDDKIINSTNFKSTKKPLVSVIIASYNKADYLMKSIRSIQNQSFKNIEIIIVDDCSNDNSNQFYNYLLKTDPRIRIFYHLKNMGLWRTRIDGFLYSRGEYYIFFDISDMYADNLVLYDAYNIAKKFNLDSVKMVFFISTNNFTQNNKGTFGFKENYTKIVYGENVTKYNDEVFNAGHIWTRFTRSSIFAKGLNILSDRVLNAYKNLWEDLWLNKLINIFSYNLLILKRYSNLYNRDGGDSSLGIVKTETEIQRDKQIQEFIYFLYFDYDLLPINNNKKSVIEQIYNYNTSNNMNLNYFKTNFNILDDILLKLISDPYVLNEDKVKLKLILIESLKRQINS